MNIYGLIILAALLIEHVLSLAADLLNLRSLRPELPEEFKGLYDAEAYRRSQEYTRARTRSGILHGTMDLLAVLAFWFAGGFNWLDALVRGWGYDPLVTGIVYIGFLALAMMALDLPFGIHSTFVIEERFGFNQTTARTFILDRLKGLLLAALLGIPLLAAVLAFFDFAGKYAWLCCWAAAAVFTLILQLIFPTWILPLFNRFKPLAEGELKEAILGYARKVGFRLENIFVMDGSRRSSKSNAFFTGFGKQKRLALFDTLIGKYTVPELVAVVAHETGHFKKKHIHKSLLIGIARLGLVFYLLSLFISQEGLFGAFYMEKPSIYAGLLFFGMLFTPLEMLLSLFLQIFSRRNEFEADRYAAGTIDRPETLVETLKKLSLHNLSNLTPHPFYVFLNHSHPPVLERIQAIRKKIRM
ncbi:MAG: M48 family metallopeptidase [Planctomycetes bacterium]|nr:M48 family metallopeptidase [Planctomycetota bacterium]